MARLLCLLLLPLAACSCATSAPRPGAAPESVIAFRALEGDLIEVPVRLNGAREVRFVLDTGIGVTLVSRALCAELGCEPAGGYVGRRMSGQEIHVPLARIGEIALGPHRRAGEVVGLVALAGFVPPGSAEQGFLSLTFFAEQPFTVDYGRGELTLEGEASLARRAASGAAAAVKVERDGPSTALFLEVELGPSLRALAEVDSGSQSLILDTRYLEPLGLSASSEGMRRVVGRDETGNEYERLFTRLAGSFHPRGAPEARWPAPNAMFQKIIHDGLVGTGFLKLHPVTFDLAGQRMIFARTAPR